MNIKAFSQVTCLLVFLALQPAIASDHPISSRLIIGFHESDYRALGGAYEVTDYINSQWLNWGYKNPVSLVRPLSNSAILIEIYNPDAENLDEIISKLIKMEKIQYVDQDKSMSHFPANDINIPAIP